MAATVIQSLRDRCTNLLDRHRVASAEAHTHRISLDPPISPQDRADLERAAAIEDQANAAFLSARDELMDFLGAHRG
jgi:hypothetical protein